MQITLSLLRNLLPLGVLVLVGTVTVLPQSLEEGWNGITLLKTTKPTVDQRLGMPEIDDNGYNNYKAEMAFVQINYSSLPCAVDLKHPGIKRGEYNLPVGTVLDMWVKLKHPIALSELKIDPKKYSRDTGGDVLNVVYYWGSKGFSMGGIIENGKEYISSLIYRARAEDKKSFPCPK